MVTRNHLPPALALIGVSGYGSIYWQYVREAVAIGAARLAAAVVINPAEAGEALLEMKRLGTRVYGCYEEMLAAEAGRIDLCLIPTGIAWHGRMTVGALEAGMNVLVEKPLAGCLADAKAIREAEARSGRWVAVGFQDMYCPEVLWLKERLCRGEIGKINRIRMVGLWPRPVSYFARNDWAGKIKADGAFVLDSPLNNAFAHFVNLCFYFAGSELEISAEVRLKEARLWRAHAIEHFDTGFVRAESAAGTVFEFFVSHACPVSREPEIRIEGSGGTVAWHHEGPVALVSDGREPVIRGLPGNLEARRAMFEAAIRKLGDPAVFICGSAIAEKHTALIQALYESTTVQDVARDEIIWTTAGEASDPVPAVRGIDEPFRRLSRASLPESGSFLRQEGLFEQLKKFRPACTERRRTTVAPG